jgi:hypothetical protein
MADLKLPFTPQGDGNKFVLIIFGNFLYLKLPFTPQGDGNAANKKSIDSAIELEITFYPARGWKRKIYD